MERKYGTPRPIQAIDHFIETWNDLCSYQVTLQSTNYICPYQTDLVHLIYKFLDAQNLVEIPSL